MQFAQCINIQHVADGCIRFIHPPSSDSDVNMLTRTLYVNCIHYYNVHVDDIVKEKLQNLYEDSISAAIRYEDSYTANEHTQYITKSWLSMIAADPLSLVQRQAKECNAHLLKTFFGNEDILRSGPVFLRSLEYMVNCFNDTYSFALRKRDELEGEFDLRIGMVVNASNNMANAYKNMTDEHELLMGYRETYKNNIIDNFEKISN